MSQKVLLWANSTTLKELEHLVDDILWPLRKQHDEWLARAPQVLRYMLGELPVLVSETPAQLNMTAEEEVNHITFLLVRITVCKALGKKIF